MIKNFHKNLKEIFSTNTKDIGTLCLSFALGAGFVYFDFDTEIQYCMLNFTSLKKIKSKVTYLTTLVISNHIYRNYSFQSWGYGKAGWDPDNYGPLAQKIFIDLRDALRIQDKVTVYNIMYAIINDEFGVFAKSYGKVFRNADSIISQYNIINPKNTITEKEFLQQHGYTFEESELFFLDRSNRGTLVTNIQEILAPKLLMQKNSNILIERSILLQDKINLSGQSNPEYSIGIFSQKETGKRNLVIYDSDLKTTDEDSFYQKLLDLVNQRKLNIVQLSGKQIFGFNIFVVAPKDSSQENIILTQDQTNLIAQLILDEVAKHPEHFSNFDPQSDSYINFISTGNTKYLNELNSPSPRFFFPKEFLEIPHDKQVFYGSKVHKDIVNDAYVMRGNPKNVPVIVDTTDDFN